MNFQFLFGLCRESPAQDETATKEPTSCIQPNPREETSQNSSGHPLDDLLGGAIMSDNMLDEFVDMTSSDPAFNSLFSLFNTDRDKFLNSERKKLSLSSSENEGKLISQRLVQWNLIITRSLGPWKLGTLLYQVSHYIRVEKQRNIKSWDQQNYLVIRGFCYIRPLYNEVQLYSIY